MVSPTRKSGPNIVTLSPERLGHPAAASRLFRDVELSNNRSGSLGLNLFSFRLVQKEACQGADAKQGDKDEAGLGDLAHGLLSLLVDGDAPPNAEVPQAIAEVEGAGSHTNGIDDKEQVKIGRQLFCPDFVSDDAFWAALEHGRQGRGSHVIAEEKEGDNAGDSLPRVVAILTKLVGSLAEIGRGPVDDEHAVNGMEQKASPNNAELDGIEEVLGNPFEEVDDPVEILGSGQGEGVQRQVLNQVVADRDDAGERVQLVKRVVLAHGDR